MLRGVRVRQRRVGAHLRGPAQLDTLLEAIGMERLKGRGKVDASGAGTLRSLEGKKGEHWMR